jgi:hypothetical protein
VSRIASELPVAGPKPTLARNATGCLALVLLGLVLFLIGAGAPGSLYCLGALACWGVLAGTRKMTAKADPAKSSLLLRIQTGLLGTAQFAAFWFAMGALCIWLMQLAINSGGVVLKPETAADLELWASDRADNLRGVVALGPTAFIVGAAILLSLLVDALWPLGLLAWLKKLVGRLIAFLAAFAAFSFVAVHTGAARYDDLSAPIRARIADGLDSIRQARQEQAALMWASALLEEQKSKEPDAARSWRDYLEQGERQCRTAQAYYAAGFRAAWGGTRHATFCPPDEYRSFLVRRMLDAPVEPAGSGELMAWVGELSDAARPAPDDSFSQERLYEIVPAIRRLADLRALQTRVSARLGDAERARDLARGLFVKAAAKFAESAAPAPVEGMPKEIFETLLGLVATESLPKVVERLRLARLPLSKTARALLRIDPVTLRVPAEEARREGSLAKLMDKIWRSVTPHAIDSAGLAELGRQRARQGVAETQAAAEASARADIHMREIEERARRDRPAEFRGR